MSRGTVRSTNDSSGVNQHESPSDGLIKTQHREFIYTMNKYLSRILVSALTLVASAMANEVNVVANGDDANADPKAKPGATGQAESQHAIIGVTANTLPQEIQDCFDAGMNDYVGKPFTPARLAAAIDRVLAAPGTTTGASAPAPG